MVLLTGIMSLGGQAYAAFPGSNGVIAFSCRRGDNPDICLIDPVTGRETAVTADPAQDGSPSFNSDGTKIAFVSGRDGNNEIYVVNSDGTNLQRLTDHPGSDHHPAWSPDGTKIAFDSDREPGSFGDVYVVNADGTGETRLTNYPLPEGDPAWSPDGTSIAFTRGEIHRVKPDGTGDVSLTSGPDSEPDWAPDGSRIVFHRYFPRDRELYTVRPDGTGLARLTNSPTRAEVSAVWSPDGRKIAFAAYEITSGGITPPAIYIMNSDGGNASRLTYGGDPSWAPTRTPLGSCRDTANSAGDESGQISRPIHTTVEPRSGPLKSTIHRINCGVVAFQGL